MKQAVLERTTAAESESSAAPYTVRIRVFHGANDVTLNVPPSTTVGRIRLELATELGIPQGARPLLNGQIIDENGSVGHGSIDQESQVEFVKEAGRLG